MKATKVTIALASALILFGMSDLQAQEKGPKNELSIAFQGLGIGSMPFHGDVSWEDQPGLSLGFNVGYTHWFGKNLGFRTGVRLSNFSHNQKISNFDLPIEASLPLSSLGLPGGSALTTVRLRGTATSIQEEQQYTYIEIPLQLAMRFGGLFVNLGISLSKAIHASADYNVTDPVMTVTSIPDLGITPNPPVPMTLNGEAKGNVKNVDMTKPFYCLLDAEVGYCFPIGESSSFSLGLFGRYAPVSYKTDNKVDIYALQPDATYTVTQPSTSAQVEKIGYYEVGVSLGVNFGLDRKRQGAFSEEQQPVELVPADNRYDEMASEIAAMKAAREKDAAALAAMKAAQQKSDAELAAMKAAQQKAEADLAAMKAAQQKAEADLAAERAARNPQAETKAVQEKSPKVNAQRKLDALGATIYFDFKSTSVKPDAEEEEAIQAICEAMKADPEMKVIITGHADNSGSHRVNWRYGNKRAHALKRYMVKQGAPAKNIKCESKGESEPVADNKTKEGRALNRRATVELK